MLWTDIYDIAIALEEKFPNNDILYMKFTDLQKHVLELDGFTDSPNRCNEKILEAIQTAWLDERS
jgi:FeS assembly protein IscX